jgi:hypothetical protein
MIGLRIGAWAGLPIEAVCVWIAVTYATVIVFETVKLWQASDKPPKDAFLGLKPQHSPRRAWANDTQDLGSQILPSLDLFRPTVLLVFAACHPYNFQPTQKSMMRTP